MRVGEDHAFRCQLVGMRRWNFAGFRSKAMNVAVTQVITNDVNDIWLVREHSRSECETDQQMAGMFGHLNFLNSE